MTLPAAEPNALRTWHDTAVFRLLAAEGPKTRAEIARSTGISKPTVLDITERLRSLDLIEDAGTGDAVRPGPRARLLRVRPQLAFGMGIEIHGDHVSVEIQDVGKTLDIIQSTRTGAREVDIDDVTEAIRRACDAAGQAPEEATATIVSTGGSVDPESGRILAWDLPHWKRDLAADLAALVGGSVEMENETNLRAIAERRFGITQDVDDFVLVALGAGIGAGIMHSARVHRGRSGLAGELGYLPVTVADADGGVRTVPARELVDGPAVEALAERHGFPGDAAAAVEQAVAEFAATADAAADAFLDELADRVSLIGGALVVVLDPHCIVLADEVGVAGGDELARRVTDRLAGILSSLRAPAPEVRASSVGASPIRRGAMALLGQRLQEHVLRRAGYPEITGPGALV